MEQQALEKNRIKIENQIKWAKWSKESFQRRARDQNAVWKKKMNWVIECFEHFFDNFSMIDKNLKEKMVVIQKSIDNFYQGIEMNIDEIVEEAKDLDEDSKVGSLYMKKQMLRQHIQHQWTTFEQFNLAKKMENLLDGLNESDKIKNWYLIAETIKKRFKDRFKAYWMKGYPKYAKVYSCIICYKTPNCLNIHNPSRKEIKEMRY